MSSIFDALREDGFLVIDCPARQVAVFANISGQVVMHMQEDGQAFSQVIESNEVDQLCAALKRAACEAKPIADGIQAEYQTHVVIEAAKGGAQ
jgi:hypothetical protein